jgi:phage-related protein
MGIATQFSINAVNFYDSYNIMIGKINGDMFTVEDLIPENNSPTEEVMGKDGAYYFNIKTLKPREIQIPCITYEGITEAQKQDLQRLLYIKTPQKLIFEDDVAYKYIYIVSNGRTSFNFIQHSDGLYHGHFLLNLISYDGIFLSYFNSLENDDTSSHYSLFSNNDILPIDVPTCVLSLTTSTSFTLYNAGSYNAKLIVSLNGSASTAVFSNSTLTSTFTISSLINTGCTINGKLGQITDQTISTSVLSTSSSLKTSLFTGNFIELAPGSNAISITAGSINLTAKFLYNHTFL